MAKRKTFTKQSLNRLPKGLPIRGGDGKNGPTSTKRAASTTTTGISPFEMTQRMKRPKFAVHNRGGTTAFSANNNANTPTRISALAESLSKRQTAIRTNIQATKKSNQFIDQRIGEAGSSGSRNNGKNDPAFLSNDAKNLARLVRERTRQSKRLSKFALSNNNNDDDDSENNYDGDNLLTHRGSAIKDMTDVDHVILSDDDGDEGDLDAYDTELHFGGGNETRRRSRGSTNSDAQFDESIYGVTPTNNSIHGKNDLSATYTQKKLDLDELIIRRKTMKLQRIQSREDQITTFEQMDTNFKDLSSMLQFRNKQNEIQQFELQKRTNNLSSEDQEYDDWDREMKQYIHGGNSNNKNGEHAKIAATDRTKTVEEIAKEEADQLHALETKRLARMNGDFDNDNLSDDGDDDYKNRNKYKRRTMEIKKNHASSNPEELDDDDWNIDDPQQQQPATTTTTRFTSEGLMYVNKDGVVIGKVGEETNNVNENEAEEEEDDDATDDDDDEDDEQTVTIHEYSVGDHVMAKYRAKEQFDNNATWYNGIITKLINPNTSATDKHTLVYTIEYDDGDVEDNVEPQCIRPATDSTEDDNTDKDSTRNEVVTKEDGEDDDDNRDNAVAMKRKRQKAMERARSAMPYVFEVPTTLDALNTMIGNFATTGKDVSLIIQRIHKANSVRLDRRNSEKMQNFYDVLLRRFVAVGDAIYTNGDGGTELDRYGQLDAITQTLYAMAQESPDVAGAVWGRRLGLFHNAYTKRLRDFGTTVATTDEEEDVTAWPSTGVILLLRAMGHIFPVTDKRHHIVTPTLLFLGQMLGHTPIVTLRDLVMGMICCGLLLEYTKEAKRIVPEVHAFLASVIRLYAWNYTDRQGSYPLPTIQAASKIDCFVTLRKKAVLHPTAKSQLIPQISFELSVINSPHMPSAILYSALHMVELSIGNLSGSIESTEKEVFAEIVNSLLLLQVTDSKISRTNHLPSVLKVKTVSVVSILTCCSSITELQKRIPLQRRSGMVHNKTAIVTLAPRIENPDRYSLTQKDRNKTATQAAADRTRREYKREHKAVSRELRLDASMIEGERRRVQDQKDSAAKAKRQRAFAWLESEQASMNQQVRQGGGLLQGGGTGAAKAKARTAKLGIKKGGKLR